ncbi:hypothetical protein BGW38_003102 [Lunasporangiospora selenospora]|uniref:Uncharacterized protein n=1 Tax=Lunasporangiospora selenospora TaxID=979761 RepID=A0A9P6G2T3_9FUNG|nr:hypothetical protein BGW38_003102 [Lunasporangiospora selenospora]
MFSSLVNLIHQPSLAIRVSNDDTTFNPAEFPNLVIRTQRKVQGKVRIIHGTDDSSGFAMISTRIWVHRESEKNDITVTPKFENKTLTFIIEGPSRISSFNIYHETTIQIPHSTEFMGNLKLEAPNTSLSGEDLDRLTWASVKSDFSNSAIAIQTLRADIIELRTSNANIAGAFEAGHIELITSNASIFAKIKILEARDGRQSTVTTKTSNAQINLHVDAASASQGIRMDTTTKNGKVIIGALLGPSVKSSYASMSTTNARIEFNMDASQSGQPLDVNAKTSNSTIIASIMPPKNQFFKGSAFTTNASIAFNLTEDYFGQIDIDTSNANAIIEGSEIVLDIDKKASKHGRRGFGPGQVVLGTSNSSSTLRFYPVGENLPITSNAPVETW